MTRESIEQALAEIRHLAEACDDEACGYRAVGYRPRDVSRANK